MPLNFPSSPTANQIFTDSTTGNRYLWDASNNVWKWTPNTLSLVIQSLAPGSPSPGQLWWNTDLGRLYIYYTDDDSSQWVEASPSSASIDVATLTSYVNVASDLAKVAYEVANSGYSFANGVSVNTTAAFAAANIAVPAYNTANAAFAAANIAVPAYNTSNAAFDRANASSLISNASYVTANAAFDTTNNVFLLTNNAFTTANAALSSAAAAVAATVGGITTSGNVISSQGVSDRNGDLRNLPIVNPPSSYTLSLTDNGEVISMTTGNVFVISNIFFPGNTVTVYNNSSANVTITQNTGVTLQWAGLSNTGNRILQQRGLATLVCVAPNIFVLTGAGFVA